MWKLDHNFDLANSWREWNTKIPFEVTGHVLVNEIRVEVEFIWSF